MRSAWRSGLVDQSGDSRQSLASWTETRRYCHAQSLDQFGLPMAFKAYRCTRSVCVPLDQYKHRVHDDFAGTLACATGLGARAIMASVYQRYRIHSTRSILLPLVGFPASRMRRHRRVRQRHSFLLLARSTILTASRAMTSLLPPALDLDITLTAGPERCNGSPTTTGVALFRDAKHSRQELRVIGGISTLPRVRAAAPVFDSIPQYSSIFR